MNLSISRQGLEAEKSDSKAMSASQELEKESTAYALEAVKYDKMGQKDKATALYQKAIDSLMQLTQLYPEYGLNKVYLTRAIAYQERIKALQGAVSPADMQIELETEKTEVREAEEVTLDLNPCVDKAWVERAINKSGENDFIKSVCIRAKYDFLIGKVVEEGYVGTFPKEVMWDRASLGWDTDYRVISTEPKGEVEITKKTRVICQLSK